MVFNKLNIIHWNIRSFNANGTDIKMLINKFNPDIISLSDTWLKKRERSSQD